VKRLFDLLASAMGLLILALPLALLAWQVRRKLGSPVLFTQVRPGLQGKPFRMVKFRTMTDDSDGNGNLMPDEKRMTKFGSFLRKSSLDELPELWNVLMGDMSLVGPRPLVMQYLPLYSKEQSRRHEVKPGITGWAQINGRNLISWRERFDLDVWYVDNKNMILDLKILWKTFLIVISRNGVSPNDSVTMPPFTGDDEKTREKY
jgi:lipopolysaccharide/colanic/teichoic acid biosynthesis glycosyltransferase